MEKLSKIFGSPARLKTLRLFLLNPDKSYTFADISTRTRLSKEAARRELADLLTSGLVKKRGAKSPIRYQVNPQFEYLDAFDAFIRETATVKPNNMVRALKKAGTPQLVALSGHFTGAIEPQIDLLVVGDHIHEPTLARIVRSLEAELGREIRYASFPIKDFRYRLEVYDRLLRDIFDYPHRLLVDKIGM